MRLSDFGRSFPQGLRGLGHDAFFVQFDPKLTAGRFPSQKASAQRFHSRNDIVTDGGLVVLRMRKIVIQTTVGNPFAELNVARVSVHGTTASAQNVVLRGRSNATHGAVGAVAVKCLVQHAVDYVAAVRRCCFLLAVAFVAVTAAVWIVCDWG